ncbi:sigma-70 family RNA polymerase sigma factor [Lacibacter luteus]|uniref:Sigma-70 family RNA polymerase sigma factor n=1 Tax=Lacibacter luteus TaxID=2508719 RepID=A0A4Q1CPA0_9BACT|nr:sigma-70 family RNA polymerase sigma factor [Lacibacter luteus]RXK62595.1 sigma-70 family RNA polymerase sigma factor [Lacibacter luteus]
MFSAATYNESELVSRLTGGDQQAMAELYDRFSGAILGIIMKVITDQATAEDVLQESMLKIWNNIKSFDTSKGRLFTWMINIARNQAIDKTRSKNFKNSSQNSSIDDSVYVSETVPAVGASVDTMDVQNWLLHLPEENRQLMHLAYFMGYTQEEISKALNMPLGTVKTKIRNSLIVLRKKLNVT